MKPTKETIKALKKSYFDVDKNRISTCLMWVESLNASLKASLKETSLDIHSFWFYDEKEDKIRNQNNSFFTIEGIKGIVDKKEVEQPIIIQNEVGYLGIISKNIDGVLYLLMQAKIEPGNINKIQISPTIQATYSNFKKRHGGSSPLFLDYFTDVSKYEILVDEEQCEQCSRFYKKYNRNVFIKIDDDITLSKRFMWLSIGDIKYIMSKYDNLVNMDTRTVLSCLPIPEDNDSSDCSEQYFDIWQKYNKNYKDISLLRLSSLTNWSITKNGVFCKEYYPFDFRFFDIKIDDREVLSWSQPLAVAKGRATFGTLIRDIDNEKQILIKVKEEIGCEYGSFYGPLIQKECNDKIISNDVEQLFYSYLDKNKNVISDVLLSEEGGRFFQEENRNIIIKLDEVDNNIILPDNYYWVNFKTLSNLIRKYRCVNIQMRNLFSLIKEY